MGIRNALGLGLLIILLKILAPTVLSQGENTTVSLLHGAEVSANVASTYAAQSAAIGRPSTPPFPLPQVPR